MTPLSQGPVSSSQGVPAFAETHWSIVLAASEPESPRAQQALEKLCQTYWRPLYAFVRWQGHGLEEAQDLTQEFFAQLLEKHFLGAVDREKGRFRSFLLASVRHFLANQRDRARTVKRGGRYSFVSLDGDTTEFGLGHEPSHELTAEKLYQRNWATTVLDQAFQELKAEHAAAGKPRMFETLEVYLSGANGLAPYAEIAARLGMTEGAVKMAVLRLRRRFGELVRAQVRQTLDRPDEVEDELRCLMAALGG